MQYYLKNLKTDNLEESFRNPSQVFKGIKPFCKRLYFSPQKNHEKHHFTVLSVIFT